MKYSLQQKEVIFNFDLSIEEVVNLIPGISSRTVSSYRTHHRKTLSPELLKETYLEDNWSNEEIIKLISLRKNKTSWSDIAIILDRTVKACVSRHQCYMDTLSPNYRKPWTDIHMVDILNGMSTPEFRKKWGRGVREADIFQRQIKRGYIVKDGGLHKPKEIVFNSNTKENTKVFKVEFSKPKSSVKGYKEGCEGKRFIQTQQQYHITGTYLNILTLLGPDPEDYIELLKQFKKDKLNIISYENDPASYIDQAKYISENYKRNNNENIKIVQIFENVFSGYAERFIDLDLMKTWYTQKNEIINLFNNQRTKFAYEKKVFCFSFSWRSELKDSLPEWINKEFSEMLGFKVEYIDHKDYSVKFARRYRLKVENSDYEIHMYYYNDGTPMINISIQY